MRTLGPVGILRQLHRTLDRLAQGPRDAPERHRSRRSSIAWTYERLSRLEQMALRRVAVLEAHWTVEAARAVCDIRPPTELVRALEALVEHGPVLTVQRAAGGRCFRL
jgi:predicted ATPase